MGDNGQTGLRERKKRRSRDLIQATAIELFVRQGYSETTLEQIAAAAEVAPRTLYRYFPTKDALVVTDEDDERMLERFKLELRERPPVEALRRAFEAVMFGSETDGDSARRAALVAAEPELQAAMLRHGIGLAERYAEAIVERTGHSEDRDLALSLAGAAVGIALVALRADSAEDLATRMRRLGAGLAGLEQGFRFGRDEV